MDPNVKGKRRCVCSVDEEGSPKGNGHTGNGHSRRCIPQAATAGMYGTLTRELVRGHSEGTARGYGRVPG